MPLQKLALRAGVNRENTSYANEGGWYESEKVRFRSGQPEKIGGWAKDTGAVSTSISTVNNYGTQYITTVPSPPSGTLWGICRSMWNWVTLAGNNLLSFGTNLKFYIQNGFNGSYYDVTPIRKTSSAVTYAFTTTSGSTTVVVNDPGHGAQTGDFVTITGTSGAVNGIPAATLGTTAAPVMYQITVLTNNTYQITAATAATSDGTPAVSETNYYELTSVNDIYSVATGWGAGGWGGATTGFSTTYTTTLSGTLAAVPFTTLASNLNATATTVTVSSTSGFAASGNIFIESEIIAYTGVTATSFTGCTRGSGGSTAVTHTGALGISQYTSGVTINCASSSAFAASGTIYIYSITTVGSFNTYGTVEAISYTGNTGTSFTGCFRSVSGTPPVAHASGDIIVQYSGATGWGLAAAAGGVGVGLRFWSQSNFGENLLFNPCGGSIYLWAANVSNTVFDRAQVLAASTAVTIKNSAGTAYTTVTPDATCPSVANYILVSDSSRFVIAFGTNDPTGVYATTAIDPMQIRWSDQQTFATWTPSVINQAGGFRLSHGSSIYTAIQSRQEIVVFTDSAVYSMQYLGAPYVWGFQLLEDNISLIGPNAVAVASNTVYWMGMDKFYVYTGRVQAMPSTLREYVYTDINLQQGFQVTAGTNEGYNEVWWTYCSVSGPQGTGTTANPNQVTDRYVIFNYVDNVWYYGSWLNYTGNTAQGRTAWLDSSLRSFPMASTYGAPTNTSSRTQGSTTLVYHENGTDDGANSTPLPIVSYVQSSDFDIGDGHNFGFVWRLIPDLTFDGSYVNTPSAYYTVRPRTNPGANYGSSNSPSVTSTQNYTNQRTYLVQQFTQQIYVRVRGRQMAFKVGSGVYTQPSTGIGVQWQLGTPRIDIRPDGRR